MVPASCSRNRGNKSIGDSDVGNERTTELDTWRAVSGTDPGNMHDDIKFIYCYMSPDVATSDGWTEFARKREIFFGFVVMESWDGEDYEPEYFINILHTRS